MLAQLLNSAFSLFLVVSPLTSYLDTILSIHRNKSSQGFSIDVCGIMLVASLLRINFWIGARFDTALLVQSLVMVVTQVFLLYECLEHRQLTLKNKLTSRRPFELWEWHKKQTYWRFLIQFVLTLSVLQYIFGSSKTYVSILGTLALGIEATLPIPQFLSNRRKRSVEGVRLSMLASWVFGDVCKLTWFFFRTDSVSIQFRLCAFVQTFFDSSIAVQYYMWHASSLIDEMPGVEMLSSKVAMLPA